MAALFQPADNSEHATPREESFNEETLDQSCDVILMVENGKEFKAHKRVLSEASPFFEKMLRSDMKESKEGMVRLEMFSESVMRDTLVFIYTGTVQILAEHNARDLIVIADYLFLENLKSLAEEVLLQTLNTLNCIPAYYVAQRYRCEGLFAKSKTFILAHFTAVCEANPEEVLNMSSKEIEMWISSDEIDVSAEEDVFRIILAWINHDRSKRKKYFADLFRQVRLVYVSRDFLCSDIVTNDLVKDNEGCLDLAEDALRLIDSEDFGNLSVTPRKSLETPVIVICTDIDAGGVSCGWRHGHANLQCYFPREHSWCSLGKIRTISSRISSEDTVCCRGKLYSFQRGDCQLTSYDLYSNCCMSSVPLNKHRECRKILVSNDDEMYALVSERPPNSGSHVSYFMSKYKPESNSWEDISLFDEFDLWQDFCIVAKDNFIYFIGGERLPRSTSITGVHRYDLSRNQWDRKVADLQEQKVSPSGAVANGKLFIAGRSYDREHEWMSLLYQCEVYNETTNEWQFMTGLPHACHKILSVDGELYALGIVLEKREEGRKRGYSSTDLSVECYRPDTNVWSHITKIHVSGTPLYTNAISGKIFKRFLDHQLCKDGRLLTRNEVDVMRRERALCEEPVYLTTKPKPKCCVII